MTSRKRRILITLVVLLVVAGAGFLTLPLILEPIVRSKLQAAAAGNLGADLHIGVLDYTFPYGVRARNVRLYSISDQTEIFSANQIEFALAKLPLGSGPLQIERVAIDHPTVRIVRRVGAQPTTRRLMFPPTMKLSDLFRLRTLLIRDGKFQYDDRREPPGTPLVWEHLNTEVRLTPRSGSLYGWEITADSGVSAAADIASSGTIDIDQLVLDVKELGVNAHAGDESSAAALPAQAQQLLKTFEAQGDARFQASAHVPLRNLAAATAQAGLRLTGARATIRGIPLRGEVQIAAQKLADDPKLSLNIVKFMAQFDRGTVESSRGGAAVDLDSGKTSVNELVAAVKDVAFTPRGFAQPIERVTGTLHYADGQLWSDDLSAQCGGDSIALKSIRAGKSASGSGAVELSEIVAAVDFHQPVGAVYPGAVGRVIEALGPSGAYSVRGKFVPRHGDTRADYDLLVSTRGGAMAAGGHRLPLTNIRGEAQVTPQRVIVRRLLANVCDGALAGAGSVALDSSPIRYAAELSLEQIDIGQIAQLYLRPSPSQPAPQLSGRCDASFSARGQGGGAEGFGGHGEMHISEGQLWELPLLKVLVSRVKLAREALTASEAAAMFDIADRKISISKAALNSPALGLQGKGTVDFDGNLDLDIFAAPFGDWERQLRKTNLPLVSDLAGSFAGGVQRLVGAATGQLLFEFQVNGTTREPRIAAVPAPILTEPVAHVLGKMMRREGNLLDMLHEKKKPE